MTTILHGCASGSGTEADSHRFLLLLLLLLLRGPKTSMFVFHPSTSRGIVNFHSDNILPHNPPPCQTLDGFAGLREGGNEKQGVPKFHDVGHFARFVACGHSPTLRGTVRRLFSLSLQAARWRVIFSGSEEKFCQLKGYPELPVGPA